MSEISNLKIALYVSFFLMNNMFYERLAVKLLQTFILFELDIQVSSVLWVNFKCKNVVN